MSLSPGSRLGPYSVTAKIGEDDVRITAQLVDARTNEQIWSDSYVGQASEIFALQDRTARAIAGSIGIAVTSDEPRRLASVQSIDPQAWSSYFRGRYHLEEYAQDPVSVAARPKVVTSWPSVMP